MKKLSSTIVGLLCALPLFGQIQTPKQSPKAEMSQMVGLTKVELAYSRPSKRGRVIFGDLIPYGEIWRTGANENTTISFSESVIIGKDTLKAGKYAIYTKPEAQKWTIYLYSETGNWGLPETWDDTKVAGSYEVPVKKLTESVETLTLSLDDLSTKSATLNLAWDQVQVSLNLAFMTDGQMEKHIKQIMSGPSANDYYRAADYYYGEQRDLNQALTWINKSLEMNPDSPYWVLRKKSLIQADLGDLKGAIETAKLSLAASEKAGNNDYIRMNKASIEEWSKKK